MSNEKIRVLFVGHTYVVGVNQQKLAELAQIGEVEVGLLVPQSWKAPEWEKTFYLERPFPAIRIYPAHVVFNGRQGAYLFNPWTVLRAIRDFRPHVIQVEQEVFSLSSLQLAVLGKMYGKLLIYFGWENLDRPLSPPRRLGRRLALAAADAVICGSRDNQALLGQWGYRGTSVIMPQLGVDAQFFRPREPHTTARGFTVGYLGRLIHEKGVDVLLEAAAALRRRGLALRLVACGTGKAREELQALAARLALDGTVEWKDAVGHDGVPEVMAEFDALVLPSRSVPHWKEQFGHVLIEAMAMGIPVVGSSCGEIPNVIGRDDLVFPEGDAAALAAILERLIRDAAWREEAGRHGLERVRQHYTHEQIARRLVALYRELLEVEGCRQQAPAKLS